MSRRLAAYALIALGLLLVAAPLAVLAAQAAGGRSGFLGIILIGPLPLIISSGEHDFVTPSAIIAAAALLVAVAILALTVRRGRGGRGHEARGPE